MTLFARGGLGGAETSAGYLSSLPARGVLTSNITPYAKANVLRGELRGAREADRRPAPDVLRQAADGTLAHSIETRPSDADELAAVCAEGLEVVAATAEQQAAMAAATQLVRDRLAADETTGPFLAQITEIVEVRRNRPVRGPPVSDAVRGSRTGGRRSAPTTGCGDSRSPTRTAWMQVSPRPRQPVSSASRR